MSAVTFFSRASSHPSLRSQCVASAGRWLVSSFSSCVGEKERDVIGDSGDMGGEMREGNVPHIRVDRSGLLGQKELEEQVRRASEGIASMHGDSLQDSSRANKEKQSSLGGYLHHLIKIRGPIPLALFMQEALTNPFEGYYMRGDVFGRGGDFTTSPEISQVVGELIGVWCVQQWHSMGKPARFRLVEVGPGRGTLMADLLRGTAVFEEFRQGAHVHMVEVSDGLRRVQASTLECNLEEEEEEDGVSEEERKSTHVYEAPSVLMGGKTITWCKELQDVPQDLPEIIIMHELFDALPVHQFVHVKGSKDITNWRERLVDVDESESKYNFRFVLSPGPTPATYTVLRRRLEMLDKRGLEDIDVIEVCPKAMILADEAARRMSKTSGSCLIVDYGEDAPVSTSLRAIKDHQLVHPLASPGHVDLSAGVDFSALKASVQRGNSNSKAYGPISQSEFFHAMGIVPRLEALAASASAEEIAKLENAYCRLVGTPETLKAQGIELEGMGETYKVMAISCTDSAPAGFEV